MKWPAIQENEEYTLIIRKNKKSLSEVVVYAFSKEEVSVSVYIERDADLPILYEVLNAAAAAVLHKIQKPRLRELIQKRIDELNAEDAWGDEEEPPSPAIEDFPF